eukprot:2209445-Prymnesium_polylepis.1
MQVALQLLDAPMQCPAKEGTAQVRPCMRGWSARAGRRLHGQVGPPPPGLWPGPALRRGEQPEALTAGRGRGRKEGIWEQGGSYRGTSTLACVEQSPAAIMLVSGAANYVEKESPESTHA